MSRLSDRTARRTATVRRKVKLAARGRARLKSGGDKSAAGEVGKTIAERALAKGIKEVVFDRGGYRYHGRVKALADAARAGGLKF